eukprot:jgi/Chrpa1/13353/Chrysochromulina_OHIO_Genome00008123-RA
MLHVAILVVQLEALGRIIRRHTTLKAPVDAKLLGHAPADEGVRLQRHRVKRASGASPLGRSGLLGHLHRLLHRLLTLADLIRLRPFGLGLTE